VGRLIMRTWATIAIKVLINQNKYPLAPDYDAQDRNHAAENLSNLKF